MSHVSQAQILSQCGLKHGLESVAIERLVQAAVVADDMGPEARDVQRRGLAGETSEGRRRLGQVRALFLRCFVRVGGVTHS